MAVTQWSVVTSAIVVKCALWYVTRGRVATIYIRRKERDESKTVFIAAMIVTIGLRITTINPITTYHYD